MITRSKADGNTVFTKLAPVDGSIEPQRIPVKLGFIDKDIESVSGMKSYFNGRPMGPSPRYQAAAKGDQKP